MPEGDDWRAYRAAQVARRHVRRRERFTGLMTHLPRGFEVEVLDGTGNSPSALKVSGHGLSLTYYPTHNRVQYKGESMTLDLRGLVALLKRETAK